MPALIFAEGFDKYGPGGYADLQNLVTGQWINNNQASSVASLNGYPGGAMRAFFGAQITSKTFTSLSRIAGSYRFIIRGSDEACGINFYNGSNPVFCFVHFADTAGTPHPNNAVILRQGDIFTAGAVAFGGTITPNVPHVVSFDITIGPSASYAVFLDGVLLLSGTGATNNGQPSVNRIFIRGTFLEGGEWDDIAIFDPTDPDWDSSLLISNVVVDTEWPNNEVASIPNTTWNPADRSNITLSNGNLTATSTLGGAWVRAIASLTTAKYYWEATLNNAWNGNSGIGLAPSTTTPGIGALSSGLTALSGFGGCYVNGTSLASLGTLTNGTTVAIAVDLTARLIWYRVLPSGNWNGSGTASPALGTGGISISVLTGSLFPIFAVYASPDAVTANFGDSPFIGVVPAGFISGTGLPGYVNESYSIPAAGIANKGIVTTADYFDAQTPGANTLFLLKIIPDADCLLYSLSAFLRGLESVSSAIAAVLYTDNNGAPDAWMATGQELIHVLTDTYITSAFIAPQQLYYNTAYWIGFITNFGTGFWLYEKTSVSNLGRQKANTYLSGAPATAGTMTLNRPTWWIWGNAVITDSTTWPAVGQIVPYTGNRNVSNVMGARDLYLFNSLRTNPDKIFGTSVKGYLAKDDSGARRVSLTAQSGLFSETGPVEVMVTTPQWYELSSDVDPNTGLGWTKVGLNTAKAGVIVQG